MDDKSDPPDEGELEKKVVAVLSRGDVNIRYDTTSGFPNFDRLLNIHKGEFYIGYCKPAAGNEVFSEKRIYDVYRGSEFQDEQRIAQMLILEMFLIDNFGASYNGEPLKAFIKPVNNHLDVYLTELK